MVGASENVIASDCERSVAEEGDGQKRRIAVVHLHRHRTGVRGQSAAAHRAGGQRITAAGNIAPKQAVRRRIRLANLDTIGVKRHIGDVVGGIKRVGADLDGGLDAEALFVG